jgi:hypothetical protein
VDDAEAAYNTSVQHGAVSVLAPVTLTDEPTGTTQVIAEVKLYGDVVLRFISGSFKVSREFVHGMHLTVHHHSITARQAFSMICACISQYSSTASLHDKHSA